MPNILTLGLGNTLLTDDGVGTHVIRALRRHPQADGLELVDGGTMGFRLAGLVAECDACIIVDAAELGRAPGTVQVLGAANLGDWLAARQRAGVHEAGLVDLLSLLHIEERLPERLAIIGVQPSRIDWGEGLSDAVAAVVPEICATIVSIARQWEPIVHA